MCLILSLGSLDVARSFFYFRRRIEVGGGGKIFVLIIILFFLDCLTHCNLFSLYSPGGDSDDQKTTHTNRSFISHTHIRSYLLVGEREMDVHMAQQRKQEE